ncbi:MAG: hypothetical protein RBT33_04155 [Candidatus Dojkabacteria bacterium]|jgi:hypothetical protein|nr:hypothetical protein [Candidatus Dojkabacteria bacterium]
MRRKQKEKYEALGFVESLIAIMVSGIVVAVLMNISVVAMRDLVKLDIEDAQAHHARSAAVIVQNIANRERLKEEASLFDTLSENQCYALIRNEDETYDINTDFIPQGNRQEYIDQGVINDGVSDNEDDYFRVICVVNNGKLAPLEAEGGNSNKMLIRVIIGFKKVQGAFTTTTDVRDYEYFAIINL